MAGKRGRAKGGRRGSAQQTVKPGYGHHRHDALPSLGPKQLAWCHLGNFSTLVCAPVPAFRIIFPPRPCLSRLSGLFIFLSSPFVPICVSVCIYLPFCFFAFLLFANYCLCSLLCFVFLFSYLSLLLLLLIVSFLLPLFPSSGGVRVLVFCSYLCSTPLAKRASLKSCENCAFSCVFSFLISCFLLLRCLT